MVDCRSGLGLSASDATRLRGSSVEVDCWGSMLGTVSWLGSVALLVLELQILRKCFLFFYCLGGVNNDDPFTSSLSFYGISLYDCATLFSLVKDCTFICPAGLPGVNRC